MSETVKDKTDSRKTVGMVAVWLIIAGLTVACLLLSYAIIAIFASPVVGGIVGGLTGMAIFFMIKHILKLANQPE